MAATKKHEATSAQPPHPFIRSPHRTLLTLSVPVLFSLIAEPLTGLIDTAFVAQLGAVPLAALGVGTVALSSAFWIFNFLGIGTQTEVAQALGQQNQERAIQMTSLALTLAAIIGGLLILLLLPTAVFLTTLLGATDAVQADAAAYVQIRLFGAPAVLLTMTAFGAMRGLQDMKTPLWLALGINILNILLDWLLIFGQMGFPELGVAGAAWASTVAQWLGALTAVFLIYRQLGFSTRFTLGDALNLLKVGRDLFIRTGVLTLYLLLGTRVATQIGADSGAAHQAIRQAFVFTALVLEAFATTAQSLIGYFMGSRQIAEAKRVVALGLGWSIASGVGLGLVMWLGQDWVVRVLVPTTAVSVFISPWLVAAAVQPLNAFAFLTDGVHWGTGDYRYLRNAMLAATLFASLGLVLIDPAQPNALLWVWLTTVLWILIRSILGIIRIWPGIGDSPFVTKLTTSS
ncbi:MAG: MATE family efflux transporter [Chloroflexota bacterium]